MMPQELKSSILQLAVQGRLVEQRPEEGTAEELYRQIQEEKQRLVKEGKIKKEKPLPEITEDEVPFDIPENWKWVRLGSLLHKLVDGAHRTPKYTLSGVPFVSVKNMSNGVLSLENTKFISKEEHDELWKRCNPQRGDLLLSKVGTTGVPAKVDTDIEFSLFVSIALLKFNNQFIDIEFLIYSILAPDFQKQCKEHTRGVGNKNWVIKDIANTLMPLPPLAEQKRIVAKIEELLPYIDRYEKAWSRLEDFNKRFPGDMQKSVLQMAIQGKLVEQRPKEGTGEELYRQIQAEKQSLIKEGKIKKEKPLPEISEDEIPFDIPESWMWVRLRDLGVTQTGNTPPKSHPEYFGQDIPFITPGDIALTNIDYNNQGISFYGENVARICNADSILQVCIGGSIGKAAITNRKVAFNQQINTITPLQCLSEYLFSVFQSAYFITTMKEKAGGTATPIINRGLWDKLLIPLPPLAEQKRIVQKLEEILPLCERLR